jgi:hypothetical protein
MINPNSAVRAAALIAATTLAAGCAQLGAIDQILGAVLGQAGADGQRTGQAVVQVQSVNTRQQVINIATQDGQRGGVRYDQRTVVVDRGQQHPVTYLRQGDVVNMRVHQTQQGEYYTDAMEIQSRTGQAGTTTPTAQTATVQGHVGQIDTQQRAFQVETRERALVVVVLPQNATQQAVQRFNQLRTGDYVGVEGRVVGQNQLELTRFTD